MLTPPSRNPHSRLSHLLPIALLCMLCAPAAFARSSNDRVSFGSDITIPEGETASDVVCAFCSVHIQGDVRGDVAVAFGSVTVDSGRTILGDVAILGGDLHLAEDAHVAKDVAIAAGSLDASPDATVRGDRVIFPGRFWLLVPFAPFLILIGIIWLVVYLVRRNRYQFPAYPNGRRM
jgi:hypothetical protein